MATENFTAFNTLMFIEKGCPMIIIDIIPDIHGQAEKLLAALQNLGWRCKGSDWSHRDTNRKVVFLGDFIDRGPENGLVIRIVQDLIKSAGAKAVMGNHELNALHYHTVDPETKEPVRERNEDNFNQHESFLREFPVGSCKTKKVLDWMKTLPLFIETVHFRAVHAAWIQPEIDNLRLYTKDGVLSQDQLIRAGRKSDELYKIVEIVAKGPEACLPHPYFFVDKGGKVRRHVRVKWWNDDARNWRDATMSVPDINQLPEQQLPDKLLNTFYPAGDRPVFFGHYWLSGEPELQSKNALCLDYSAGTDGPLVTYTHVAGTRDLSLENVVVHQ